MHQCTEGVRCKVVFLLQCTLYCGGWSGTLEEDIEENNNTESESQSDFGVHQELTEVYKVSNQ